MLKLLGQTALGLLVAGNTVWADDLCWTRNEKEPAALQATNGLATREGPALRIRAQSRVIEYLNTDCSGESPVSDCRQYEFLGRLSNRWFLIHIGYWEGGDYALIDPINAEMREFESCPRLSPSGNRFIVTAGDESGYDEEALQIWGIETGPPLLLWTEPQMAEFAVKRKQLAQIMTPEGSAPAELPWYAGPVYAFDHWIDDNRVVVTESASLDPDSIKRDVLLIHEGRGWGLQPLP